MIDVGNNQSADPLLRMILTSRVYDVIGESVLGIADRLSRRTGNSVLLKREDLQPIFSFKVRGAYNRMAHLTPEERERGVITASAGNHGQGVAFSARKLGIRSVIVMPRTAPSIKVDAVKALGGEVVLAGDSYMGAKTHCDKIGFTEGLTFIHPYDDPLVIAGQGTVGLEIIGQSKHDISAVFIPVGGGGLIAGIGSCIKALMPGVRIIGVEPADADAMTQSLECGQRIQLKHVGMFADGVAVREVGALTFSIASKTVDEMVCVSNDEICAAIKDIFDDTRSVMEPAGALAVAGLKRYVTDKRIEGQRLVAVLSGANMNFDRLRFVAERAELGEAREAVFAVTIHERPGAFREFCAVVGRRVVTEFNYRLSGRNKAHVFVGVGIDSGDDASEFASRLRTLGYEVVDLSDNEMAKLHVRHMVGGHAPDVREEIVYRFEFPERPGALMEFLEKLGGRWNISLFHYRNHGADFGRVLVGFEVPKSESDEFIMFLKALDYPYLYEPDNIAYQMFLK